MFRKARRPAHWFVVFSGLVILRAIEKNRLPARKLVQPIESPITGRATYIPSHPIAKNIGDFPVSIIFPIRRATG